jgi:hypothetical protein
MPLPPGTTDYWGPISIETPAPLQPARYVRNGLVPHAQFESHLTTSLNFAAASRPKELFRYYGNVSDILDSGGGSTRSRWRFAAHTSPQLRQLRVTMLLARQTASDVNEASAKLYITDAGGSTTYSVGQFWFGTGPHVSGDVPSGWGWGEVVMTDVPPDTDIFGRFEDVEAGRLISAMVVEECLPVIPGNGYMLPPQVAVKAPIYDKRYQGELTLARDTWRRGAAHLLNWTADTTAQTTSSGSPTNIVDGVSTTVSAATPGYYLDLRYCGTRTRSDVPVVMAVYASVGPTLTGTVTLVDSGGSTVLSRSVTSTTPAWVTVSGTLPSSLDKYDLQFSCANMSVYAVSLYQHAT